MFKQVITGILAAAAAIAVLAWSRRGERPIVLIPDAALTAAPHRGDGATSWPPLELATTTTTTRPATRPAIPWDRRVGRLKLENVTLEQAMSRLAAAAGVNIVVGVRSIESTGVDRTQRVSLDLNDVSLRTALKLILVEVAAGDGIAWSVEENVIFVGGTGVEPEGLVTRVYNVRDLVVDALRYSKGLEPLSTRPGAAPPDAVVAVHGGTEEQVAEALRSLIVQHIDPNDWADNGGAYGQVTYFAGLLVIDTRPEAHAKVERLLASLRGRP